MKALSIYNAGKLFAESEIAWRKQQGRMLRERFKDQIDLYNPIDAPFNEDKDATLPTPQEIFEGDFAQLQKADVLLFDYSELDDPGVSCEIGIMTQRIRDAVARNDMRIPRIIGILSDSRSGTAHSYSDYPLPPLGTNHMVLGINLSDRNVVVRSFEEAMNTIARILEEGE